MSAGSSLSTMSNDAFAGFLRLLLTPLNDTPEPSAELGAYLDFLRSACPTEGLEDESIAPCQPAEHAA